MKLTIQDPESKNISKILLDGKPVPMAIAFDTDENWVISLIPELKEINLINADDKVSINDNTQSSHDFKEIKRYGKVEVYWSDSSGINNQKT